MGRCLILTWRVRCRRRDVPRQLFPCERARPNAGVAPDNFELACSACLPQKDYHDACDPEYRRALLSATSPGPRCVQSISDHCS